MATIWETLGIEPTTDEAVIRRAYARELKQHRPDQDPQGYQQLREAFDAAKEYANGEMIWLDGGNVQAAVNLDSVLAGLTQAETQVVPQRVAPLQPDWQRETLEEDAERFSVQLLMDESDALNVLRHYLDHSLPDALEARRVFSLELAQALSQRQGISVAWSIMCQTLWDGIWRDIEIHPCLIGSFTPWTRKLMRLRRIITGTIYADRLAWIGSAIWPGVF